MQAHGGDAVKIIAALTLALLATAAAAAIAATDGPRAANETIPIAATKVSSEPSVSAEEALATDAASYAADRGLTLAEARTALADQAAAGDILERLEQEFSTFAGGWIEHGPTVTAVARFQGSVPQGATAIAAGRAELIGGAGRTLAQLSARANEVHDAVAGRFGTSVATSFDVQTGIVHVSAETPAALRGLPPEAIRARLPETARAPDVRVTLTKAAAAGVEHTRGGAKTPWDGGAGYCTTAFSVAKNGTYGFVTAGHCQNDRSYRQPEDGLTYNAPYQAQHRGDWGDFQWHTTPHDEYAEFYTTSTGHRDVLGYDGSIAEGDYVCKYGRTSGYGCGYVKNNNVNVTFDGITHRRLVAMRTYFTEGGDSGGPWFLVNDAMGVHSGWVDLDGARRSTFSRIVYADEALGLALVVK
jgi:streptogrisin C